jgi:hypothetical protein
MIADGQMNPGHVCRSCVPRLSPGGHSVWVFGWRRYLSSSTFLRPFAPPELPGFVATMDALTPERRFFLPGGSRCGNPAHERRPVRSGLSVSRIWSSGHPVPNHPSVSTVAFAHNPSAQWTSPSCSVETRSKLKAESGFRHRFAGSPSGQAEAGSLDYGLLIHLLLLPTPPRGDAVTFGYRPECVYLKRTCTSLAKYAYSRTNLAPLGLSDRTATFPKATPWDSAPTKASSP